MSLTKTTSFVRSGLLRELAWVYEISSGRWNENGDVDYWQRRQSLDLEPRYAHQLVYEKAAGLHFMFGGNPVGKERLRPPS